MGKLHSYDEGISFYHIDEHAKKAQSNIFQRLDVLVSYLSECIPKDTNDREILLTPGFLVWYAEASTKESLSVPSMFHSFCICAGIESKLIRGNMRKSHKANAKTFDRHTWNAFKSSDNAWHLVDSYWCVACTIGGQTGGLVALETNGNTVLKRVEFRAGINVKSFNGVWFCTHPNLFLNKHFPDDPTWQLLPKKQMSFEKWSATPYLSLCFFEHRLRLLSEESSQLKTTNGQTTIMLLGKDVAEKCTFPYKLYLKESDASTINPGDLPRLVFPGREGDIFKFDIRFPVKGTYFIDIQLRDIQSETSVVCASFMIECNKADPNCRKLPVDTGIMGFGYGPMAEEVGLKKPPVKGSKLVLKPESENDEKKEIDIQTINFKLDVDAINDYEYGSDMYEDENQEPVTTLVNESKRQLEITPPVRPDSEYALVLTHRRKHTNERFKPVLYYMVTTSEDEPDESQTLALQKRKEILHEEKKQEKMEKNFNLKEKIRQMKAAIDKLTMKGSQPETQKK